MRISIFVLCLFLFVGSLYAATLTVRTAASSDDGTQSNSVWYPTLTDAYIGRDAGAAQHQGMRFNIAGLQQGATINSAKLTFRATANLSTTSCKQIIYCEDTANATTFGAAQGGAGSTDFLARLKTTASVNWTIPAWTSGTDYDSPDFAAPVQEVVNRSDFAGGYLVVFLWDDPTTTNLAYRQAYYYNGSSSLCPLLTIDYTNPGPSVTGANKIEGGHIAGGRLGKP